MEFPCNASCLCVRTDSQQICGISLRLLKEVVTTWSLSFDSAVQEYNRFEGEIVAETIEWGKEGDEEGLEALFAWTLNGDRSWGGTQEKNCSPLRCCFEKGWEEEKKGARWKVRVRVKTFSPSPRFTPLESGYEEGTVSITKIKWLLATLCWVCPPFVYVVVSCSFLSLLSLSLSCALLFVSISRLARFTL